MVDSCTVARADIDPDAETVNPVTGMLEGATMVEVFSGPCLFQSQKSSEGDSASRSMLEVLLPHDADIETGDVLTVTSSTLGGFSGRSFVLESGPRDSLRVLQRWHCEIAEEVR